jgi:hypothetical protein
LKIRVAGYKSDIIIDGAVNAATLPIILGKRFKPDYAGIGSFLTKTANLEQAIKMLDSINEIVRV